MTEKKVVRTRMAPSPTGYWHVGNLRTALFSYFYARANGGQFIVRIEDTDRQRLIDDALLSLVRLMSLLHIVPDEGPMLEVTPDGSESIKQVGEHGPYIQSERLPIYQQYAQQLLDNGSAYYCFCSSERLEEVRREQQALKKPPMYDRLCRNLPREEALAKKAACENAGEKYVIRMAVPLEGETVVHDHVYGDVTYKNEVIDDQILMKSDGFPTYHLAVVVDDNLMRVTHVFRGEEWLPSTPKHILLYQAFGWEVPEYAHLPLILNADKTKLSKRKGDVTAEGFLHKGYLKEALINFLALLGWNPKTEQEIFSLEELIAAFDLTKLNKAGAVFDYNKLDWMNAEYIKRLPDIKLLQMLKPYWAEAGVTTENFSEEFLLAIVELEKERLKKLSDITESTEYFFSVPEYDSAILTWRKSTPADAKEKLTALKELFADPAKIADADFASVGAIESALKKFIDEHQFDNGSVLWPLRVALTGQQKSPSPFEVAYALFKGWGREGIVHRLEVAIAKLD